MRIAVIGGAGGMGRVAVADAARSQAVDEVTIAGNLREMFGNVRAVGADVDRRSHILTGSILVDRMTIAGS